MINEKSYLKFRNYHTHNLGTGQNPNKRDEFGFCHGGGVDMPAPTIFRHATDGAGKPEVRGNGKK